MVNRSHPPVTEDVYVRGFPEWEVFAGGFILGIVGGALLTGWFLRYVAPALK